MKWIGRLREKCQGLITEIRKMSVAETCRAFLLLLMRVSLIFYLAVMVAVLPFYFYRETGYTTIGSSKSELFQKWGIGSARLFVHILLLYLVFALFCWWKENRQTKHKAALLISSFFDGLSITDKFVIFYMFSLCLSYYYSPYPEVAQMGTSGWYMGFFPQIVMAGSYFAITRLLPEIWAKWTAAFMLLSSFGVFLLGVLNRYGVNPLGMASAGPSFISTIGNINWYCGYWTVLFPLGAGMFLLYSEEAGKDKKSLRLQRAALGVFTAVGFAAGITQGSDSGMLALAATLLLLGWLAGSSRERMAKFFEMLLVFCGVLMILAVVQLRWPDRNQYITGVYQLLVQTPLPWASGIGIFLIYVFFVKGKRGELCRRVFSVAWRTVTVFFCATVLLIALAIAVNTRHPGSLGRFSDIPLFTFGKDWGSSRGGTWSAGITIWQSQDTLHKIIGTGPDTMASFIYEGSNSGLLEAVREQFGNSRLTNAHGEWITVLSNLGVMGLLSFAGMMISAIVCFVRAGKSKRDGGAAGAVCAACGISLFCYTVNNVFSFQQVMNITQMFLVMGLGGVLLRQIKYEDGDKEHD